MAADRRRGEFDLIAALRERAERAGAPRSSERLVLGSGDDAAITAPGDAATATSVDAIVEGVHFERALAPLSSIGRKGLAAALSDLAAVGAAAGEAYVQLGLPEDLTDEDCLELADGFAALAAEHGVAIAGGDLTRSPVLFLALTVVGYLDARQAAVRRSGARAGDAVVVTAELGGAAAGLVLLRRPELAAALPPEVGEALRGRQLEPQPRLAAGRALAGAGASAMIDLSDGLGGDARHLAAASDVALRIELERVPVAAGVAELAAAGALDPVGLATAGGEDYELLATLAVGELGQARAALDGLGVPLTQIGTVAEGEGVELIDAAGAARPAFGFDQLAPPSGSAGSA